MKRPNIEEIEDNIDDLLIQATKENSHFYVASVLEDCLEIIKWIKILEARPNWNKSLHNRYLESLDERDALQEQLDVLAAKNGRLETLFAYIKNAYTREQ